MTARRKPSKSQKPQHLSADEIRQTIEMARAAGLRSLKVEGLEFEFSDQATPSPAPAQAAAPDRPKRTGRRAPTSLELLLWSTGEPLPYDHPDLSKNEIDAMLKHLAGYQPPVEA